MGTEPQNSILSRAAVVGCSAGEPRTGPGLCPAGGGHLSRFAELSPCWEAPGIGE